MNDYKILVVDDEVEITNAIEIYLTSEGYKVVKAFDGLEALSILEKNNDIDLIILDIMMPKLDGINTCLKIREKNNIPIIMLSAKGEDSDKILGLNVGADDYITKPFNHLELVARAKSQLRRYEKPLSIEQENIIKVGDLEIDTLAKTITLRGEEIKVTATEFKILHLLASNRGRIFSIKEIYEKVWEEPFYKSENTVTVHIRRIREKIELNTKEPEYIKVVWGIGYKIEK